MIINLNDFELLPDLDDVMDGKITILEYFQMRGREDEYWQTIKKMNYWKTLLDEILGDTHKEIK